MGSAFFFLLHRYTVSTVPTPGAREMGKSRVEAGSFFYLAHRGELLILLEGSRGRSAWCSCPWCNKGETPGHLPCVQLFAVSWLVLKKKTWGLETMNSCLPLYALQTFWLLPSMLLMFPCCCGSCCCVIRIPPCGEWWPDVLGFVCLCAPVVVCSCFETWDLIMCCFCWLLPWVVL